MTRPKKNLSAPMHRATAPIEKVTTVLDWVSQQAQQDLLRFIICGSEDDGKGMLIERLLWESQQIFEDRLVALPTASKRQAKPRLDTDFALFVDSLTAEHEQGATDVVAYRVFATPRRKFVVADILGNQQSMRNMLTGASTADVAVILVDARDGVSAQARRHVYLLSLAGIKQVVLAVNKMDLVAHMKEVFDAIVAEFHTLVQPLGFTLIKPIPLSALNGDNIAEHSALTPWYQGPTLMGCLEILNVVRTTQSKPAFPVQWVNRPNSSFRGFSGTLASGDFAVGDKLRITASGETATLKRIATADGDLQSAHAGDAVTLVLDREVSASRGDVIALADQPLEMTDHFEATLLWMHDEPGHIGRAYEIKLANQWASVSLTSLKYRVNVNTPAHESCKQLALNDIAIANLALSKPLVFEPYGDNRTLGAFILVDKFSHATVAAGMIRHNLRRAQNVHRQALSITREARERFNGHPGKVIWFTGLSGSGKSTIANALEKELHTQGKRTYILDGDNIRQGLNKDLGFTDADRVENIRRVAEVAKLMMDAGLIVMTAFISPFRAEREMARELIGAENFIEVFVDTPLEVCEQRDPKGLYKKARSGQLPNMTGINSPYEPPLRPTCVLTDVSQDFERAVCSLSNLLQS